MKVSAVIMPRKKYKRQNRGISSSVYFSVFAVLAGLICGTLVFRFMRESVFQSVFRLFISFFSDFSNKSYGEIISGLILSELPYIFVIFILAFSVIGSPFIFLLSFAKSLAPTLLFSYLYCEYGLKGTEYVFLVLAPGEIISLFGMLLLTQSCLTLSSFLKRNQTEKGEYRQEIKAFSLKLAVGTGVILLSRLITFLTVIRFSSLFTF